METTSKKHIALLAEFCAKNGVKDIVISPGSRNAPIIIAFEALPEISVHLIHDERSAGFFALGLSEASSNPVALTCTSGSALLNYSPAIVEAYYRQIPLLVLTADRPEHLIDQGDGQTMRQANVYANFCKKSLTYPESGESIMDDSTTILNELFSAVLTNPKGPVHLNIPLDEPLYEVTERVPFEIIEIESKENLSLDHIDFAEINEVWETSKKKLILIGQHISDPKLDSLLSIVASNSSVAVLVENTSNVKDFQKIVHCIDRTLALIDEKELEQFAPELLITIGGAVISKRVKAYFRKYPAKHNWRIGFHPIEEDTFQSLTKTIKVDPAEFIKHILDQSVDSNANYGGLWKQKDLIAQEVQHKFLQNAPYSDLTVFDLLLDSIPDDALIHMGNSSVVRYCQLFEPVKQSIYYSNRGVSGIDGSTSTAAGFSVHDPNQLNVLISGDISFFYDSNAFWNTELKGNFKVIVISNGGGGIFQIIPGPAESDHSQTFFAPINASVKGICTAFDVNYFYAENLDGVNQVLNDFFSSEFDRPCVLEINTKNQDNAKILSDYFEQLAQASNN